MPVSVGDSFPTFAALENKIKRMEEEEALSSWKRDSRTIDKAKSKGLKRYVKPDLTYYSVQYSCYHGGRWFKSRSTGLRTQHRFVKPCILNNDQYYNTNPVV